MSDLSWLPGVLLLLLAVAIALAIHFSVKATIARRREEALSNLVTAERRRAELLEAALTDDRMRENLRAANRIIEFMRASGVTVKEIAAIGGTKDEKTKEQKPQEPEKSLFDHVVESSE